jgi:hypothetical protein
MSFIQFTIVALAVWRISSFLVDENGPWSFMDRFRHSVGVRQDELTGLWYGETHLADLLTCVWCTSFWVAILASLAYLIAPETTVWLSLPFALSAVACIISEMVDDDDD